ncbi:DUF5666 domain-containing protein [Terriglobus aquaticus]|uniref:DUF5666 domain-containing protein n=1 Tax=Terriglobus aquaticus TaxID=940139 RepID=A0ABW9KPZ2_9BACT
MKKVLLLFIAFGLFAGLAYAHNGMEHIMGTVTAISSSNITVKTMEGKTQTVALAPETKVIKASAAAVSKDIKVGDHVVIHAAKKGNVLTAAEVKIGAMNMKSGDMSGMKMDGPNHSTPQ